MEIDQSKSEFDWLVHVKHIDEFGKNLSEWEINFVESMLSKTTATDKQIEIIKRIYDEKC